jgi:hypothetical protein
MHFDKKNKEKKIHYNLLLPNFFSYMEYSLKYMQSIKEVVAEEFLTKIPNFVTLKTSAKTSSRRCYPCSVVRIGACQRVWKKKIKWNNEK